MIHQIIRKILLLAFLLPSQSSALVIEPIVSYKSGKVEEGANSKSTLNGTSVGGKLGWELGKKLVLGFDGNYASLEQEYTANPRVTYAATQQQYGIFLAFYFSTFRASGSYLLLDQVNFATRNEELRGDALKLGLSIPVINAVHANFDFVQHNFKEAIGGSAVLPTNASTIVLSLSYLLGS